MSWAAVGLASGKYLDHLQDRQCKNKILFWTLLVLQLTLYATIGCDRPFHRYRVAQFDITMWINKCLSEFDDDVLITTVVTENLFKKCVET